MRATVDPSLVALCGSETRALTLGVLANARQPMTGYRVAKVGGVAPIKVYQELRKGIQAKLIAKDARGFRLVDPDIRALFSKKVRLSWSPDWFTGEKGRAARAKRSGALPITWYDPTRYQRNPVVAARYAPEIERPPEKDRLAEEMGLRMSRKRK